MSAEIIYRPDPHRCHLELNQLGPQPFGTVARCSCGKTYEVLNDQRDGNYWNEKKRVTT